MVVILIHGNNQLILCGPVPDDASALALARNFHVADPILPLLWFSPRSAY